MLAKYAIEPWQLIFEVTECSNFCNAEQALHILSQLQKMGVRIAIDDFGTGYASYARLKSVDADILKIDGDFIRNIVNNSFGLSDCGVYLPSGAHEKDAGGGGICRDRRDT